MQVRRKRVLTGHVNQLLVNIQEGRLCAFASVRKAVNFGLETFEQRCDHFPYILKKKQHNIALSQALYTQTNSYSLNVLCVSISHSSETFPNV